MLMCPLLYALDSNKFGQKLLEKMGWSKGKGLGAKEDGIKEHVRVSFKNDSKGMNLEILNYYYFHCFLQGMGYKETEEWSQHEENFSTLLENLSKTVNSDEKDTNSVTEIKVSSLEEKSKTSKARVHYKKFTRGKDLSRYSEKDLANIFGKKTLKPVKVKEEEIVVAKEENKCQFGVQTINGGSMTDYFKNKIKNFDAKSQSDSETEETFGFGFKQNDLHSNESKNKKRKSDSVDVSDTVLDEVQVKVEKKKPKKSKGVDEETSDFNTEETMKIKKKKKKLDV